MQRFVLLVAAATTTAAAPLAAAARSSAARGEVGNLRVPVDIRNASAGLPRYVVGGFIIGGVTQ